MASTDKLREAVENVSVCGVSMNVYSNCGIRGYLDRRGQAKTVGSGKESIVDSP